MPTESEFLAAADQLRQAGRSIALVSGKVSLAFTGEVAIGGQLTADITSLVTHLAAECKSDESALDALTLLCRDRAAVVGVYAEALGIYSSELQSYEWAISRWERNRSDYLSDPFSYPEPSHRPSAPVRPSKPAPWVEL